MAVMRFISSLLLLVAVVALVADVTHMRRGTTKGFQPTTIARQWQDFAPSSLQSAKSLVTRKTHPMVWSLVVRPLIYTPVFVLFGILAALFGYLGRRRQRVEIYTN